MAQPDLVLVIEPGLVVVGPGRVENPLPKAFAHSRQVISIWLAGRLVAEKSDQERMRGDEAIPDIEDILHLVFQNIVRLAQGLAIFVAEQDRLLEQFEVCQAQRRAQNGAAAVGIARNCCLTHACSSFWFFSAHDRSWGPVMMNISALPLDISSRR